MQSLTVGQIAIHLKALLERDPILTDIWVSGEVSNLSRPNSGHLYFTLKDEHAQLRCALFRMKVTALSTASLKNGAAVLAHGYVSFYESRGDIQLYVDAVQPAGAGLLAAEFERLRVQLEAEGLFAPERKRALPRFPRRIGVVTSASGAAFHDICQVLTRRWPLIQVVLAAAQVQGDGAAGSVVAALDRLNRHGNVDLILLARGGGSIEDLWTFNEERVARAVFASAVPVVSAVGHEIDYTICDFVADLRAPTPSAAAELIVPDRLEMAARITGHSRHLQSELRRLLERRHEAVERAEKRMYRCRPDSRRTLLRISDLRHALGQRLATRIDTEEARLRVFAKQLEALSPLSTLARGYSLTFREDGGLMTSAAEARPGDAIKVRMSDGGFDARVERRGNGAAVGNDSSRRAHAEKPLEQSRLF
jgi:exodeoxyribonuclease VII large subunit